MKLVYIANARIPTEKAHGFQIMKMCESFSRLHVEDSCLEVELWVPARVNPINKDPFDYYGIENNFKIKRFSSLDLIIFDKYIGHFGFWIQSFTFMLSLFPYVVLSREADIFYTRDKFFLPYSLLNKKIIHETHGLPGHYFLYLPFLSRIEKIIAVNQKLKRIFTEIGIEEEKIKVAHDGVDIENFNIKETKERCRKKLNLPLKKKIVLYAGHLYKWKGVYVLAKASRFLSEGIEIFFIGGTSRDIEEFKRKNSDLQLNVIGHRPHPEIPYWLKAADVLVLPNIPISKMSKYWTSPLKLFEYMSSKRPIIASRLPSICEILNEENSILVEPGNPRKIAEGIENVLENSKLYAKISEKAFEDVQQYTWQKRAQDIISFIHH